jgi:hypothetical protein
MSGLTTLSSPDPACRDGKYRVISVQLLKIDEHLGPKVEMLYTSAACAKPFGVTRSIAVVA